MKQSSLSKTRERRKSETFLMPVEKRRRLRHIRQRKRRSKSGSSSEARSSDVTSGEEEEETREGGRKKKKGNFPKNNLTIKPFLDIVFLLKIGESNQIILVS